MAKRLSGLVVAGVAGVVLLLGGHDRAAGFGTVQVAGQHAEHERITRKALACDGASAEATCFQPETLDVVAGKSLSFGAVGAPDNPTVGLLTTAAAHCDAGDYLDVAGYPQTKAAAQRTLEACRAWMKTHMAAAIAAARKLVSNKGKISAYQASLTPSCVFAGRVAGRAKCTVIEEFGIVLHAAQDFYSHSNWTDGPPVGAPTAEDPPGLGEVGPAPWLNLRTLPGKFPAGLISGCFETASIPLEERGCNYGPGGTLHRVKHAVLNKDKGVIGDRIEVGTTSRGSRNANFVHAVQAAIADSQDKWATLREGLVKAYGPVRGAKMICVLTHDDPTHACAG
ncbi:MAG: CinY protein [Alphaproteobacteria bacterium]|nr:CinY protein [Alphaproteobacteria bacterium]